MLIYVQVNVLLINVSDKSFSLSHTQLQRVLKQSSFMQILRLKDLKRLVQNCTHVVIFFLRDAQQHNKSTHLFCFHFLSSLQPPAVQNGGTIFQQKITLCEDQHHHIYFLPFIQQRCTVVQQQASKPSFIHREESVHTNNF